MITSDLKKSLDILDQEGEVDGSIDNINSFKMITSKKYEKRSIKAAPTDTVAWQRIFFQ